MNNIDKLREDAEFRFLMPRISNSDYVYLEKAIFRGDISAPIYTWKNIILVGYNTFDICKKYNIITSVRERQFTTRNEAICWICHYYLQMDDITETMKKYLVGKQFETQKEINGIKRQETHAKKMAGFIYQTALTLGNEYNMAQNTVYKYGIYSRAMDAIFSKQQDLADRILSGALKVSHDNIIELSRLSTDYLKVLNQNLSKEHIEHIGYSEMRHELLWKKLPTPQPKVAPPPQTDIPIKQLPKYDPDSEISSLTLTIPSWISSISRTRSNADFRYISEDARNKLVFQLVEMKGTIETMLNTIKEDCNG